MSPTILISTPTFYDVLVARSKYFAEKEAAEKEAVEKEAHEDRWQVPHVLGESYWNVPFVLGEEQE